MFRCVTHAKLITITGFLCVLLSGCGGDLRSSVSDGLSRLNDALSSHSDKTDTAEQIYVQTNHPLWCQPRQANNPAVGCWVSPRCDYDPHDFYYTKDPTDDRTEDYWFKSVTAWVADPGYKTLINGQLTELDGRWFLGGLWYTNNTCTGEPAFYTDGYIHAFYRVYGNIVTREGLNGTVLQLFSSAADGATYENLRYYDLFYATDSTTSACYYDQDLQSPTVAITDDPGETVLTGVDFENCFTYAEPGTANWMTDKLERKEDWQYFYLYQGNNIWVNGWDNSVYHP